MTVLIPRDKRRSRHLFDWTAQYAIEHAHSLDAITGHAATFTRASVGTGIGSNGYIARCNHSQPRFAWYDTDADGVRESPHLLLEAAGVVGWTFPEALDNAAWTKTRSSITANATIAPDGLLTADKLVEDATASNTHFITRNATGSTASTPQSFAFFARAGERTWLQIEYVDRAGATKTANVNLATGAQGTVTGTVTFRVTPHITALGWYRVEFSHSSGTGGGTPTFTVFLATGDNGKSYSGDGASGAYIWGLEQLTDKAAPHTYQGGTAAVVDTLTYTLNDVPKALTMYARFIELGTLGLIGGVMAIGDSTNPTVFMYGDGTHYSIIHRRSSDVSSTAAAAPVVGDRVELRGVLKADGSVYLGQSINGAAEVVASTSAANALASAWNSSVLRINARFAGATDGMAAFHTLRIAAGEQTLATMRES